MNAILPLAGLARWIPRPAFRDSNKMGSVDQPVAPDLLRREASRFDECQNAPTADTEARGNLRGCEHLLRLDGVLLFGVVAPVTGVLHRHPVLDGLAVDVQLARLTPVLNLDYRLAAAGACGRCHVGVSLAMGKLYHTKHSMSRGQIGRRIVEATP